METLQRTANRGSVSTGYEITHSLKFDSANTEAITTNNQAAGNQRTFTWSGWIKRTRANVSVAEYMFSAGGTAIRFVAGEVLHIVTGSTSKTTSQVFRDTSAWFHLVWIVDTTQSTEADRSRIYLNGSLITDFSSATYPSQNTDLDVGGQGSSLNWLQLGQWYAGGRNFNGYMAEIHYLNGTVAEPSNFGETDSDTGIWIPKEYTGGNYGTQGYYFKFDDSSNLGKDSSGESHDANSLTNISAADQATDTPTNNFCVINAINLSTQTLTQGATKIVSTDNTSRTSFGTMAVSKGKWWWEGKIQVYESNTTYPCIGVTGDLDNPPATSAQLFGSNHVIKLAKNQKWVTNDTGTSYGTTYSDNDIINIGLDMDNHIMYTYKNGTIDDASGINFSSQSAATADDFYIPINLVYVTGGGSSWEMNFGGFANYTISSGASDANGYGNFEYAPPSGYYAICTKNLAEFG